MIVSLSPITERYLSREAKQIIKDYDLENPDVQRFLGISTLEDMLQTVDDLRRWDSMSPRRSQTLSNTSGRCYYCGVTLQHDFHVDHFIAKSRGGPDDDGNLVASCPKCNMSKSNLDLESFRKRYLGDEGGLFWFETLEGIYLMGGPCK